MRHYAIADIDVEDPGWVGDYVANVTGMVERYGGRYLARTAQIQKLEGDRTPPGVVVLIEWPSREVAEAFYESDEYRPYRERRRSGSSNEFTLIAGEDMTTLARITD